MSLLSDGSVTVPQVQIKYYNKYSEDEKTKKKIQKKFACCSALYTSIILQNRQKSSGNIGRFDGN